MSPPSSNTATAATREAASSRCPVWESSVPFFQYPVLTRSNYFAWAARTRVFMRAQGLWEAVQPGGGGAVDERTEAMALAVIYQGIPDEVVPLVVGKETAREAWEALETVHLGDRRGKVVRIHTLQRKLRDIQMEEEESVHGFAMRLMGVVASIRALGEEVWEAYVIEQLLRAVPTRRRRRHAVGACPDLTEEAAKGPSFGARSATAGEANLAPHQSHRFGIGE